MTRVGKILVILLSTLSVLFLGFATAAVSTMTDWKAKYDTEVAKSKEQDEKRSKLEDKIKELTAAIAAEAKTHKSDRDDPTTGFEAKRKGQEKAYREQEDNLKQAKDEVTKYTAKSKAALEEGSSLRKKGEELQETIKATKQERDDTMKERFALEQQRYQLEGSYETISARHQALKRRADKLKSVQAESEAAGDSTEKSKKIIERPISKK